MNIAKPDLNLLITLDALLEGGGVAAAARRLGLSSSAVSRGLDRLRKATGDPLLVRAGRGLVPTPRALDLRERVAQLVADAESVLRPVDLPDLSAVARSFTIRTSDGFVENFGPGILQRVREEAPGVQLHFIQKLSKDSTPLREGTVDLETGVVGPGASPEPRVQSLFHDRFLGVVRKRHRFSKRTPTLDEYADASHVAVSRRPTDRHLVDQALGTLGRQRKIACSVGGFATALELARSGDLVATVPERHTGRLRQGMHSFPLPFPAPEVTVSMLWHPRMHADPVHRWLRACVRGVCE